MNHANHIVTFPTAPTVDVPDVIGTVVGKVRSFLGLGQPGGLRPRDVEPDTATLIVHVIARLELTSLPNTDLYFVDGLNAGRAGITDEHGQCVFRDLALSAKWPLLDIRKHGYAAAYRYADLTTPGVNHLVVNLDRAELFTEQKAA